MYEGVLVRISDISVTQTPNQYNEWYVNDGTGECQIDDGFFNFEDNNQINTGDEFLTITGIVDFGFSYYGLNPRNQADFYTGGIGFVPIVGEVLAGSDVLIEFLHNDEMEISLWWKTFADLDFEYITMTPERDYITYSANIPGQSSGETVQYYVTATDTSGVTETYPQTGYETLKYIVNSHKAILNVQPKPFNPRAGETFPIEFASKSGNKAILRIYNSEGKLVYTPKNLLINDSSGIVHYDWNGRDKNSKILPIGLYICYLEVIEKSSGKKKTAKAPIVIGAPLK
jgi:hypothetical protein